jgi:hypothetical protein
VDEGKLLLFMMEEVVNRPPRSGKRSKASRKRPVSSVERRPAKRLRAEAGPSTAPTQPDADAVDDGAEESEVEEGSDVVLMYNTVRGYVSAIKELWSHQTSRGLHNAPQPHRIAIKAVQTMVSRQQHQRLRDEYKDRGIDTLKDGYTAAQIPDVSAVVWRERAAKKIEPLLRGNVGFLLGNSMLMRASNQLPLELPDLFLLPLPKEGPAGAPNKVRCLVATMQQGKSFPLRVKLHQLSFITSKLLTFIR